MSLEEVPHPLGDEWAFALQREVAGVEEVILDGLQVSRVGLGACGGEDLVVLITAQTGRMVFSLPSAAPAKPAHTDPAATAAPAAILTDAQVRRLEADNIRRALQLAGGKVSGPGGAAELLGFKPTTLASRLKALGIHSRHSQA